MPRMYMPVDDDFVVEESKCYPAGPPTLVLDIFGELLPTTWHGLLRTQKATSPLVIRFGKGLKLFSLVCF